LIQFVNQKFCIFNLPTAPPENALSPPNLPTVAKSEFAAIPSDYRNRREPVMREEGVTGFQLGVNESEKKKRSRALRKCNQ